MVLKCHKYRITLFFVILFSVVRSQHFSSNDVKDYKLKNDSFPFFVYDIEELDSLFNVCKHKIKIAEGYGLNSVAEITFRVDRNNKVLISKNCNGQVLIPNQLKDRKLNGEDIITKTMIDSLSKLTCDEAERLIKLTEGLWFSDSLKEKNEIRIKLNFFTESYDRLNGKLEKEQLNSNFIGLGNLITSKDMALAYNIGVRKFGAGKIRLAKRYFEHAVKIDSKDVDAYYNLASCYYKLKEQEKACECWNKCLALGDNTVQESIKKYCNKN